MLHAARFMMYFTDFLWWLTASEVGRAPIKFAGIMRLR